MNLARETFLIIKTLPHRGKIALGCCAATHLWDLYRLGKPEARATVGSGPGKGRDLAEYGLELAWRFALDQGADEGDVRAVQQALEAQNQPLLDRMYEREPKDVLIGAAACVVFCVMDTLGAVLDQGKNSVVTRSGGVFNLYSAFPSKDEDAPTEAKNLEEKWRYKVAKLLQSHGDKPLKREMFTGLLAEELPWRTYLPAYEARCAGREAPAPVEATAKPAKKAGKKDAPTGGKGLDALPPEGRVAVAAACAEHALDFYRLGDFKLRVRHAPGQALKGKPEDDLLEHALKLAWRFASTGKADEAAVEAALAGLMVDPDGVDPEDMGLGGATMLGAVGGALRAIEDETGLEAKESVESAAAAISDGLGSVVDDEEEVKRCAAAEEAWQARVLAAALRKKAGRLKREDFAALIIEKPAWHKHRKAYAAQFE